MKMKKMASGLLVEFQDGTSWVIKDRRADRNKKYLTLAKLVKSGRSGCFLPGKETQEVTIKSLRKKAKAISE